MFEVLFFDNGNTMHFKEGKQVPELQKSWFMLYIKFLEDFSDFLVACTRSTRELYVAYGFWWIKKWEAANQAPEADH